MNDKFFDLKKEKQDRMINAALKIFALNGYAHASTDDIVKEAGISKGLLFHYFSNKIGLYSFVFDYAVKYVSLEVTSSVDKNDNDFFGLHIQIKNIESMIMRGYPYMIAFLNRTQNEDVLEAINAIMEKRDVVPELIEELFKHANSASLRSDVDIAKINKMIDIISKGILSDNIGNVEDHPEYYAIQMKEYLLMLKSMSYRA